MTCKEIIYLFLNNFSM